MSSTNCSYKNVYETSTFSSKYVYNLLSVGLENFSQTATFEVGFLLSLVFMAHVGIGEWEKVTTSRKIQPSSGDILHPPKAGMHLAELDALTKRKIRA